MKNKTPIAERFYTTQHSPAQNGLYRLLFKDKKIPVEVIVECLNEYEAKYLPDIFKNMSNKETKYWAKDSRRKAYIVDQACYENNFSKFLAIVTEKTGAQFKFNTKPKRKQNYNDWWQEANLDGTFAYNGVTDDF